MKNNPRILNRYVQNIHMIFQQTKNNQLHWNVLQNRSVFCCYDFVTVEQNSNCYVSKRDRGKRTHDFEASTFCPPI